LAGKKRFAFTIVDDTDTMLGDSDEQALDRVRPIYDLLLECGLKTTRTAWVLSGEQARTSVISLENDDYLKWILALRQQGVEIAIHGAAGSSSDREKTARALGFYRQVMGEYPRIHTNHVGNIENIYWYDDRLVGVPSLAYKAYNAVRRGARALSLGHKEGSRYFWGDLCREKISFVRNFVFRDINTLANDPWMPYHSSRHPFVRSWFSASDGGDARHFTRLLSEENQDRLVEEGGACIVYTHFAFGFVRGGKVDSRFAALIRRLSRLAGYFVPASELLGYLKANRADQTEIPLHALRSLQSRWLRDALQAS
jgi:hypothetical protein